MKKLPAMMGIALIFYGGLLVLQLVCYFLVPAFYAASPAFLNFPDFIHWAFVKYFTLILLLYLAWAAMLGLWNGLLLPLNQPRRLHKKNAGPYGALCTAQFFGTLLYLGFLYPSAFQQYPILRQLPLMVSYMLLAVGILVAGYCFLRSRTHFILYGIPQIVLSLLLPIGIITLLHQESKLSIPQNTSQQSSPDILIIGIDALDGDTGSEVLQKHLKNHQGVLFTNAFTPLPLTHPAWNSILTGLYPKHHGVRYFFDSPLASKNPELFLPEILKRKKKYLSLFASDQPETSYFTESQGFSHLAQHRIGWEAHLAVTMLNHFIFPALWLNNPWVEAWGDVSFNYAGLFNFDFPRFVNQSFEKFSALGPGPKMLALHTCALHSPIRLTHEELRELPRYWTLAPADFSFAKWPRPGWPQQITPPDWINPYFSRRATVVRFLQDFLDQLETRGYLRKDIVVLLSDHGERFIKDREIYGGVHGVDIQTREQNNVVFTIIDPLMSHFKVSTEAISLIDLTPTLLSRLGISTELMRFDGVALLNEQAKLREPPERPLWVESMGFFDDHTEKDKFPEFNLKTLEESLRYGITGTVSIDEDYYERILSKKETVDIAKTPDYFSIR